MVIFWLPISKPTMQLILETGSSVVVFKKAQNGKYVYVCMSYFRSILWTEAKRELHPCPFMLRHKSGGWGAVHVQNSCMIKMFEAGTIGNVGVFLIWKRHSFVYALVKNYTYFKRFTYF